MTKTRHLSPENIKDYFSSFFKVIKKKIRQRYNSKSDDQLPYRVIAFRNAVNSLPCPVSLVKLNVDQERYSQTESDIYYLIKFDFSLFGEFSVTHHGESTLETMSKNPNLIETFTLNEQIIEDLKRSKMIIYGEDKPWAWYWYAPHQVLSTPEEFAREFLMHFEMALNEQIQEVFGKEINYSEKYELKDDPVLPSEELLQIDKTVDSIFKPNNIKEERQLLEDLQHHVCSIQLSPKVPDNVKKVFSAAKKLYVFGYFEYYFFTISKHYTFLALESALRNRHDELYSKPRKHLSLNKIIDKLVQKKAIRKADEHLYLSGKDLRNGLSHLTQPPIFRPSAKILENTAFLMNQLFEDKKYQ